MFYTQLAQLQLCLNVNIISFHTKFCCAPLLVNLMVLVHAPSLMLLLKQTSINATLSPRGSQQRISTHVNRAVACMPGCTEGFVLQQQLLIPSTKEASVAVAWRVEAKKGQGKPNQDVESFQCHGPNCLSYHYMHGGERQPVIAAYLLPETLEDLHHLQAAFDRFKNRCPPMLMADLNVDLCSPSPDLRTRQVADFLAANGTEDVLPHFHSRRRFRHQKTWCRLKNALRARCTLWGAAPLGHYVGYQKSTVQGNSTKACIIAPKWVQTVLQIICTTLATIVPRLHPFHLSSFFN